MTAKENALLFTLPYKNLRSNQIKGQFLGKEENVGCKVIIRKKKHSHLFIQRYIGLLHCVICN